LATVLQDSFKKSVVVLEKKLKKKVQYLDHRIAENETNTGDLPGELKAQVNAFEKLMETKVLHLGRKLDRLTQKLAQLK